MLFQRKISLYFLLIKVMHILFKYDPLNTHHLALGLTKIFTRSCTVWPENKVQYYLLLAIC